MLFFVTLSILLFNFFLLTALRIVLLALLNDPPIMTIAYDNVLYSKSPEKWKMREILTLATLMGFVGVIATIILFYLAYVTLGLSLGVVQSLIFLKLAAAGHLTLFVARTRGPFWSVRPALPLLAAVILTQLAATLIVVYGIFIAPIGWYLAGIIWLYAIVEELVVMDRVKVYVYRLIDHGEIRWAR